jgi:cell volume regulation protein A
VNGIAANQIVFLVGVLVALSVLANRISDRLGVPTLLVFLGVGMLAGSDGIGGIYFDDPHMTNLVGIFALAYILFSGGLDTEWRKVRCVVRSAALLATLGVALTALLVGLFAQALLDISLMEGLLLGAIVSSTDAAAVFAVLRSRGVGLKGGVGALLELESGSNDPMAVLLTVTLIGLMTGQAIHPGMVAFSLLLNLAGGLLLGLLFGYLLSLFLDRLHLEYEGLYPVLSMSLVLVIYGASDMIGCNGFLAVYVAGIVLASRGIRFKRYLTKFHDGLGWLMQILLFLTLGLLVFPSQIPQIAVPALLVALFLMFVARPVAVYLMLLGSRFTWRERTLVAWTGLRGAVPIVLATFPFLAGFPRASILLHIVFFVVLLSALLQGSTLMTVARWLGVDEPLAARPRTPIEVEPVEGMRSESREIELPPESAAVNRPVSALGLPAGVLIVLIRRESAFLVPRGDTLLRPFDTLTLLGDRDHLPEALEVLLTPDAEFLEEPAPA